MKGEAEGEYDGVRAGSKKLIRAAMDSLVHFGLHTTVWCSSYGLLSDRRQPLIGQLLCLALSVTPPKRHSILPFLYATYHDIDT